MNNKKGILEWDRIASWFLYGLVVFFVVLLLQLGGCNPDKVRRGIESDAGMLLDIRASAQLSAYLRTDMPDLDTLSDKMLSLKDKGFLTEGRDEIAIDFLEKHPELYVGKNYGEFISGLYAYREDREGEDREDPRLFETEASLAFETVTMAMFHRKLFPKSVRDANKGDESYFSPIISVKYGMHKNYILGQQDLISAEGLSVSSGVSKILPTHDKNGVTVQLHIHAEEESLPLP